MANLQTTYMGIPLKNPIIAGASELTAHLESIQQIEASGVGALVMKSLFEEQIQLERFKQQEHTARSPQRYAEMMRMYPKMVHAGPEEHVRWVKKVKETVQIPVIASLNAVNQKTWLAYAKLLQETGIDGIELNFYAVSREMNHLGSAIEKQQIAIAKAIVNTLSIPVSVKLSPFYTNPVNVMSRFDQVGVKGLVLFNRMFQADIDVEEEKSIFPLNLSHEIETRLPLQFTGLLSGNLQGDICSSTGISQAADVIKMILAGAQCVQVVSVLYKKHSGHIQTMLEGISTWMEKKGCRSLNDFRGKLSKKNCQDPCVYTRAQYVRLLFESDELIMAAPLG